jgi:UDP-hydrolysing UDP-N-acetyl-D-glucosamine 2-epimerase
MTLRLGVITGARADYGLVRPVLRALCADPAFEPRLVVTGMHLAEEFGLTVGAIEADGIPIAARVAILEADDSGLGVAHAVGRATAGIADALAAEAPDLVVLVGDRFEQLAAAQAALFLRIPVAHLYGGDLTVGAFDESIRHAITKLAHLHFVSNEASGRRVRQLGEDPANVHVVGSPALDELLAMPRPDRADVAAELGVELSPPLLVVTFHPATLDPGSPVGQLDELLAALEALEPRPTVVFTRANADPGGRALNARIDAWVEARPRVSAFASLGNERYRRLMAVADAVVGNSSSGLYEAPSLGVPTVNIGDRQHGRERAASVIDVPPRRDAILRGMRAALAGDWSGVVNPYGDGRATERIMSVLRAVHDPRALLRKPFHEIAQ